MGMKLDTDYLLQLAMVFLYTTLILFVFRMGFDFLWDKHTHLEGKVDQLESTCECSCAFNEKQR
jgi:hypothetical protein